MPPVRPVRETFASYGSRQRDIMGKVHFASSTVHSPWTALRVRWVPLYCFPTLSLRSFAMCVALLGRHRARYLTARLPMPPVRPVRETFTSYGSRERGVYRKLPFRHLHGTFPVVSLRVRWVPLYHFPPLSLRAFAMCAVFPCSDSYAQFDCLQGLGDFGTGLPCLLPTLLAIPCRLSRVQNGGLKQDDGGGVLLAAPSALCGSPVPAQGTQVRLCLLPHGRRNFHVSDLTSQTSIGVQA